MVDQRHRGDADAQPEHRDADREPRGDDRAEREQQDDQCSEQSDQLGRLAAGLLEVEEQVAAHLDAQRVTPPRSPTASFSWSRSAGRGPRSPGTGSSSSRHGRRRRPPPRTPPAQVPRRARRQGPTSPARVGSASTARCARASSSRATAESKKVVGVVGRRRDQSSRQARLIRLGVATAGRRPPASRDRAPRRCLRVRRRPCRPAITATAIASHTPMTTRTRRAENRPIRYSTEDIHFSFDHPGGVAGHPARHRLRRWSPSSRHGDRRTSGHRPSRAPAVQPSRRRPFGRSVAGTTFSTLCPSCIPQFAPSSPSRRSPTHRRGCGATGRCSR